MRDDLHKGTNLNGPQKKALRACLRPADHGERVRQYSEDAVVFDLRQQISPGFIERLDAELRQDVLDVVGRASEGVGFEHPLEHRIAQITFDTSLDLSEILHSVVEERVQAIKQEIEAELASQPGATRSEVEMFRREFSVKVPRVVERLINKDSVGSRHRPLDPNESIL